MHDAWPCPIIPWCGTSWSRMILLASLPRNLCLNLGIVMLKCLVVKFSIDFFIMWIAVQKCGSPSVSFWSCLDGFTTCYTVFKQCQNAIHTGCSQSNIQFYRSARQYGYVVTYIRCTTYTATVTPQVGFSFACLLWIHILLSTTRLI